MAFTKIRQSQVRNLAHDLELIREQIKTFKQPVALITDLPLVDNNDGDLRVCLEDGNIYIWSETNQEWSLSSGKGAFTKTLSFEILQDNQTEINTKIRFDGTTDLQTTVNLVNVYLNGMLVSPENYLVKNVNEELIIEWTCSEELLIGDMLNVQYYDTTGGISQGSGGGSKYEHPDTHPASMIIFNDGETFEEKLANGTLKGEQGESGVSVINDNSVAENEVWSSNKVNAEIENLKQFVSNGKELIATAVTDKGVNASSNDSFNQLCQKINQIETLKINGSEDIIIRAEEDLLNGDLITVKDSGNTLKSITFDSPFDETDTSSFSNMFSSYDRNKVAVTVNPMTDSTEPKGLVVYNKSLTDDLVYTYSKFPDGNDIPVKTIYADFSRDGKYLAAISTAEPFIELLKLNENENNFYKLNNFIVSNEISVEFDNLVKNALSCVFTADSKYLVVYCEATGVRTTLLVYKLENDKLIPYKIITNFTNEGESAGDRNSIGKGRMFTSPSGKLIGIITNIVGQIHYCTIAFLKYDANLEEFNLIRLSSSNVIVNENGDLTLSRDTVSISFTPDERYILTCVPSLAAGPLLIEYNSDNDTFSRAKLPDMPTGSVTSTLITKNGYVFISNRSQKLIQYKYSNGTFTRYSLTNSGPVPSTSSSYVTEVGNDGIGLIISGKIQSFERQGLVASKIQSFGDIPEDSDYIAIVKQDCVNDKVSQAKKILDI